MNAQAIATDVAARIRAADDEAADAIAASVVGRFGEWFDLKMEAVSKRVEDEGEQAITRAKAE